MDTGSNGLAHHRLPITLRSHVEVLLRLPVNWSDAVCAVAIRDTMFPDTRAVVVVAREITMSSRMMEHALSRVLSHRSLSVDAVACSPIEEVAVVLRVGRRRTVHVLRRTISGVRRRQRCCACPSRCLVLIPHSLMRSIGCLLNMFATLHARKALVLRDLLLMPGRVGRMRA